MKKKNTYLSYYDIVVRNVILNDQKKQTTASTKPK